MAKLADQARAETESMTLADIDAALQSSFDALDEPAAQAALDRLLITFGLSRKRSRK